MLRRIDPADIDIKTICDKDIHGSYLRMYRLKLNKTQEEMAAMLGVATETWGRWERDKEQPAHVPMLVFALEYLLWQSELDKVERPLPMTFLQRLGALDAQNEGLRARLRVRREMELD